MTLWHINHGYKQSKQAQCMDWGFGDDTDFAQKLDMR